MKPLQRIKSFFTRTKSADYPTVTGGFDVFRNFIWDDNWGQGKFLQTYEKSLYVFACVRKIAMKTASIDWNLYQIKNRAGDKEEVFVHEALDLLYRPNPFQTKGEFYEKTMINKLLTGESFILKVRDASGTVRELWNLRPDMMRIVIDKNDPKLIKGYEFVSATTKTMFAPEDIIHDAYPSPLEEFGGLSALSAARVRVDTEEFASKYQSNFFKNNARPDFILSSENKIDNNQKENIKEAWEKRHKGAGNSGKGAFLEGGLKYQQVSISQKEMDYIESMRFTRDDILVAFQVPKPIVAITDDVNLANAKTAMEIFLSETIEPEIRRLTEKLNEHLVYPEYGPEFFIHYDESFMPTNEREEAEVNEIHLRSGAKLLNEVREEMGMEPVVGGWSLYKPINEVAVGGLPQNGNGGKTRTAKAMRDKRIVFRGRAKAYEYLKVRDEVRAKLWKEIAKTVKKDDEAPKITKYIKPEIRDKYADIVNKQIDQRGERFKPELLKFADEQRGRVIKELAHRFNSVEQKALDGAFDVPKEKALLAEVALPFIEEYLREAGVEAMLTVNPAETFDITERIQKYIKDRAKAMAKEVNSTTVDKLSRTLAEGVGAGEGIAKLTDRVNAVYEEFPTYRAETIARTEATAANNRGFVEAYEQSGVANAKEWIATGDGKTRDSHSAADGDVVGLEESFENGLKYPGDPAGPASETINCRCVLAPAFRE